METILLSVVLPSIAFVVFWAVLVLFLLTDYFRRIDLIKDVFTRGR